MSEEQPERPKPAPSKTTRIREDSVLFRWVVPAVLVVIGVALVVLLVAVVLVVLGVFPGL